MTSPLRLFAALLALALPALAAPAAPLQGAPGNYYNGVDDSSPAALRATLHDVIDDHTRLPYTSSGIDTWFVLERAQEDPSNSSRILDVYRNRSFSKGSFDYNREHTWPRSFGIPDDNSDNYPFTDCHMLRLCDDGYNTARSNKPFRNCNSGCSEYQTDGGGSGGYPGNSNWSTGSFVSGTWEVWMDRRGDVARGLLYADVRYEGGLHGITGANEHDLRLTNSQSLIAGSQTGSNEAIAYMGMLDVLLQWHAQDPVDAFEMNRNDVVFQYQGNRNPFVDHPEWVDCLWNNQCNGTGGGSEVLYCTPAADNSTGNPASISSNGDLSVASNGLVLFASQMPSNQFGYFLCSQTEAFVIGPGGSQGNLCLGGNIGRFNSQVQSTGVFGTFQISVDLSALPVNLGTPAQAGETWSFQCWFRDANPAPTSNFTDGLRITFE